MSTASTFNAVTGKTSTRELSQQELADIWLSPEAHLAEAKREFAERIDGSAETVRMQYLSPGNGMMMTYREKFEQAKAVVIGGQAVADAMDEAARIETYPTLAASVGVEAPSLWECAQLVVAKAEAWADISYQIEKTRLGGKAAVAAASSVDAVKAAYGGLKWPNG